MAVKISLNNLPEMVEYVIRQAADKGVDTQGRYEFIKQVCEAIARGSVFQGEMTNANTTLAAVADLLCCIENVPILKYLVALDKMVLDHGIMNRVCPVPINPVFLHWATFDAIVQEFAGRVKLVKPVSPEFLEGYRDILKQLGNIEKELSEASRRQFTILAVSVDKKDPHEMDIRVTASDTTEALARARGKFGVGYTYTAKEG